MAANPLVAQGTLNRVRGAVIIDESPELNVTASFLGKEGIQMSLEGEATLMIGTMTGNVTSAEPYQMCTVKVHLLKSQAIAQVYKDRMELNSLLGGVTVKSDSSTLGNYSLLNCAVQSVDPMQLNGTDAGFVITIAGTYIINNDMWNIT